MDLRTGALLFLDHGTKTYAELDLAALEGEVEKAMGEAGVDEEQMQQMAAMMQGMMKFEATVVPGTEKKTIGKWSCRKYDLTLQVAMSTTKSELWTTTVAGIKPQLYQKIRNSALLNMPGVKGLLDELEKIQGVTVMSVSETSVMGTTVRQTEELVELKEMAFPPGTFAAPSGYAKKEEQ
jgi:hypothetical protein